MVNFYILSTRASFQVCASIRPGRVNSMSVCQLGALQCLGQKVSLLQDSACSQPETKFTSCQDCGEWETCDGGPLYNASIFYIHYT